MEATIDFNKEFVIISYTKIKLQFLRTKSEVNNITISPRVEQVGKLNTNVDALSRIKLHTKETILIKTLKLKHKPKTTQLQAIMTQTKYQHGHNQTLTHQQMILTTITTTKLYIQTTKTTL